MYEKMSKLLMPLTKSTKIVGCALQVLPTPPQPFHADSPWLPPVVATQFRCGHEDLFEDLDQKKHSQQQNALDASPYKALVRQHVEIRERARNIMTGLKKSR